MKKKLFTILVIPIIFLIYGIYTLNDYGINWDEPYHFRRGQAFLQYFLSGKKDYSNMPKYPPLKGTADSTSFRDSEKHFKDVQDNPNLSDPNFRRSYYQDEDWNGEYHINIENSSGHPALNGIFAAFFNKIFYQKLGILGDLESYHLFEVTTVSFLVFFIALFMWKEYGMIESISSSLALTTYPLLIGEQHFNIKDPIIATFYATTLISVYKAVTTKSLGWLLLSILFFSIGLSVKFNIIFIIIPMGLWFLLYFFKNKTKIKFDRKFYLIAIFSPVFIISFFILFFPTLWNDPLQKTISIVQYYLHIGYSSNNLMGQDSTFSLNLTPLKWIVFTSPLITIFLFLLSLAVPKQFLRHKLFPLLLIFSLLTTLLRVTLPGTTSYGGVRQIMEYIPILAMLCGIGAGFIFEKMKFISKHIFIILIIVAYIPITIRLINLHPNENVYFNRLVGGLSGAKMIQLDSWGNSYGNAYFPVIEWLNKNAEENAKLTIPVGSISNIPRFKLRPDISLSADYWSGPENKGEYVLELIYDYEPMKWYSLNYLNTVVKPVYEVTVDGIAIAKLWKNSPEYVSAEFKKQKEITNNVSILYKLGILELILPNIEKLTKITLTQPIKNCNVLNTGYVDTSTDNINWTREIEDVAREQLKHAKQREMQSDFTFYFVAKEAKYIRFHSEDTSSCLLKAFSPKVYVLE
ncbi:MAG: hypothetical protein ACD_26C00034G0035 [uncultured bacterium]|nr:MAG: hypothetical protein ACD_26C00034G0035 [uncultured bacterium]